MSAENASPTRMELMSLKNRTALAVKGHQLLKQKRDVLILELMAILHPTLGLRDRMNGQVKEAYSKLLETQSYHQWQELEALALASTGTHDVTVTERNVMGVRLPTLHHPRQERRIADRGMGIALSSAKTDEAAKGFETALQTILEVAEKEVSVKRLLSEIEKTKRRVNALDYIVIPQLKRAQAEIAMKLDEAEREEKITLKTVKQYIISEEVSRA